MFIVGVEINREKCVIIGDIKKSREIPDWESAFVSLRHGLEEVNRRFEDIIYIPFVPTVGDEFQGALNKSEYFYEVFEWIRLSIPLEFRAGTGFGHIEKPFDNTIGMRGSAFYHARDAIDFAKNNKKNIVIRSNDPKFDEIINPIIQLIEDIKSDWTQRQREIINFVRRHPDYSYSRIGEHFGITRQAVEKTLKSARWETVREAEVAVQELTKFFVNPKRFT